MFALGRRSRGAVAGAAIAAMAGAFVAASRAGTTASLDAVAPAPGASQRASTPRYLAVLPRRDPFAGGRLPARVNHAAAPAPPALPPIPAIPGVIGALPPNLPHPANGVRVTAIVTGAHASAIVQDGDTARIVREGDLLHGTPITTIDSAGVHVAGGGTLLIAASPAPGGSL